MRTILSGGRLCVYGQFPSTRPRLWVGPVSSARWPTGKCVHGHYLSERYCNVCSLAIVDPGYNPDTYRVEIRKALKYARRILRNLAGREHELWTGVCLWRRPEDVQVAWQEVSRVAFKTLTDAELDHYLATRTWEGCSGAYAIQEEGDPYLTVAEGSVSNVIGLPMESLVRAFEAMGRLA